MADGLHEEEVLGKAYDARLMRRLLAYLRPYRRVVFYALIAIFFFGLLQAVPPYLMKVEIDRYLDPTQHHQIPGFLAQFLSTNPREGILQIALAIFLPAVLLTFVLQFAQTFAMQLVGQKVMYDLRKQEFEHLQRLQMSYFDRNPVGRLVTRVTTDIDVLNDMFASGVVANEIRAAMYTDDRRPPLVGFICGLGGREVTLPDVHKAADLCYAAAASGKSDPRTHWLGVRE